MSGLTPSKIPYLTHNWPVVTGCTPCSLACENCWSKAIHERFNPGKPWTVRTHDDRLDAVIKRRKPAVIGVAFTADLFHPAVDNSFLDKVFAAMAMAPQHVFIVLTKRPAAMRALLSGDRLQVWPLPNVLIGVTVWDQDSADARVPMLQATPAAARWVSYEPALGPVDFGALNYHQSVVPSAYDSLMGGEKILLHGEWECSGVRGPHLDWIVAGCEQLPGGKVGRGAGEVNDWLAGVGLQCEEAAVPSYCKQRQSGALVRHRGPICIDLPELLKGRL